MVNITEKKIQENLKKNVQKSVNIYKRKPHLYALVGLGIITALVILTYLVLFGIGSLGEKLSRDKTICSSHPFLGCPISGLMYIYLTCGVVYGIIYGVIMGVYNIFMFCYHAYKEYKDDDENILNHPELNQNNLFPNMFDMSEEKTVYMQCKYCKNEINYGKCAKCSLKI